MIKAVFFALTVLIIICGPTVIPYGLAEADVVDFEDLYPGYDAVGDIPLSYAGFSWSTGDPKWITKYYMQNINGIADSGYEFGTRGNVSLYTAFSSDISISDGYFDFAGAYITSAGNYNQSVTVEGWANGSQVYSQEIVTSFNLPVEDVPYADAYWFDFNFTGVDTVWFRPQTCTGACTDAGYISGGGSFGDVIVIDDITYSIIPEPVSSILFVTGGAALGLRRFWKKRRTAV